MPSNGTADHGRGDCPGTDRGDLDELSLIARMAAVHFIAGKFTIDGAVAWYIEQAEPLLGGLKVP